MQTYFTALFLTIAVEFAVYYLFERSKPFKLLLYSFIINGLTHPIAFYFYSEYSIKYDINNNFNIYFLIIEIIVFLAEIIPVKILLKVNLQKAAVIAFAANFVTALLSFVF